MSQIQEAEWPLPYKKKSLNYLGINEQSSKSLNKPYII